MVYYGRSFRYPEVRTVHGRRVTLCLLLLVVLAAAACGVPSHVTFIPEGGSYTVGDLIGVLDAADPGTLARVSPDEVAQARQQALTDLRAYGDDAAALADTLTAEFPPDVTAVPFSIERGTFEGVPAWIVIEGWGDPGGRLEYRRLWVFAYGDRSVLAAQSMR